MLAYVINCCGGTIHSACVSANMRGTGEPIFETNFLSRANTVGEILSGPANGMELYGHGIVERPLLVVLPSAI